MDWAYGVWDDLVADLKHKDNQRRAIAGLLLCKLAKSDPKQRMLKTFPALLEVTPDPRFVTARHTLLALWQVGAAGKKQHKMFVSAMTTRCAEAAKEKNGTLVRYDILQGFRKLYDTNKDASVKRAALALIETETDSKYAKKYSTLWKKA